MPSVIGSAQVPVSATPAPGGMSLPDLFTQIRLTHPRIAAAQARIEAARGSRRAAGVPPNPAFGLAVENAPLPGRGPAPTLDREVMTTAMFPLAFAYQRGPRVRRASAEVDAMVADAGAERQRVALDAARAYYRVALAQIELASSEDLAGWLDSLTVYHERRAGEGLSAEAELIRIRLERERAWSEVATQRAELARVRAVLGSFLGDSTPDLAVMVTAPDAPLPIPELPGDPAAWDLRPDVRAARARLAAAGAGVGVAASQVFPEVSATAGLKWSAGTSTLLAGLSLPLPLLNQNGGERIRAGAEREAAGYELALVERQARSELFGARDAARILRDRIALLAAPATLAAGETGPPLTYLERAETTRRLALEAHREGAIPLIQVLDAARAWAEARSSYYRTLYAQHESVLMLLAAEGRDLFAAIDLLVPPTGGR